MRCPKCSFISFDDLSVCAKCASDLSALSKELRGTCIEAKPEFYLGSAIQAPGLEGDNFSDSQLLPPIDHSGINFDDTSTGGFVPFSASPSLPSFDVDDHAASSAEDDVAIELGDIMPIDLDQLDDTSVFTGEPLVDTNSFDSADFALNFDKTETMTPAEQNGIDLDMTGKYTDKDMELSLDDDLSGIELDQATPDFEPDKPSAPEGNASFDTSEGINLDDELIAQLVSFNDDLDSTDGYSQKRLDATDLDANDTGDMDGPLDLDESLVAELTGAFPVGGLIDEEGAPDKLLSPEVADPASHSDTAQDEVYSDLEFDELFLDEADATPSVAEFVHDSSITDTVLSAPVDSAPSSITPLIEEPVPEAIDLPDLDFAGLLESSLPETLEVDSTFKSPFDTPIEDLTGEFLPIVSDDDEVGFTDFALADIDVSDLLETSEESVFAADSIEATAEHLAAKGLDSAPPIEPAELDQSEVDFAGLAENLPPLTIDHVLGNSFTGETNLGSGSGAGLPSEIFDEVDFSELEAELNSSPSAISAADMDDLLPEIELIADDEGPPDLPPVAK